MLVSRRKPPARTRKIRVWPLLLKCDEDYELASTRRKIEAWNDYGAIRLATPLVNLPNAGAKLDLVRAGEDCSPGRKLVSPMSPRLRSMPGELVGQ